jgi:hypothetical protein
MPGPWPGHRSQSGATSAWPLKEARALFLAVTARCHGMEHGRSAVPQAGARPSSPRRVERAAPSVGATARWFESGRDPRAESEFATRGRPKRSSPWMLAIPFAATTLGCGRQSPRARPGQPGRSAQVSPPPKAAIDRKWSPLTAPLYLGRRRFLARREEARHAAVH